MSPRLRLAGINLDSPDPAALARFYARLLGWEIVSEDSDDVILRGPDGPLELLVQRERAYERPVWPAEPGRQQMMAHLDIHVDDLDAAVAHALDCGATLPDFQPQKDVRVCLDPDGHPFCLYL